MEIKRSFCDLIYGDLKYSNVHFHTMVENIERNLYRFRYSLRDYVPPFVVTKSAFELDKRGSLIRVNIKEIKDPRSDTARDIKGYNIFKSTFADPYVEGVESLYSYPKDEGPTKYEFVIGLLDFLRFSEYFNYKNNTVIEFITTIPSIVNDYSLGSYIPDELKALLVYLSFCFSIFEDRECTKVLDLTGEIDFKRPIFLKPHILDFKEINHELGIFFIKGEIKIKNLSTGKFIKLEPIRFPYKNLMDVLMFYFPFVSKVHLFFDKRNAEEHSNLIKKMMSFVTYAVWTGNSDKLTYNFIEE